MDPVSRSWLSLAAKRLARVALIIVSAIVISACGFKPTSQTSPAAAPTPSPALGSRPNYAVIIDAGSTGSRIHIYQWRARGSTGMPWVAATPFPKPAGAKGWVKRVTPGLSAFRNRPGSAAESLRPLIEFAKEKLRYDPETMKRTRIYLMATAGMRRLSEDVRGEIMENVKKFLEKTPFKHIRSEVITGEMEGLFGWISVNYLLGKLQRGRPEETVGALDLGGASTQITFVPENPPRFHGRSVKLGGTTYRVYSYSYLGHGQDQAATRVASESCYPRNYPLKNGKKGTGEIEACRQAIISDLRVDCTHRPCSLMGEYQPELRGEFLAFSGYWYTAAFFKLSQPMSIAKLEATGSDYCRSEWTRIVEKFRKTPKRFLARYCFSAAYISALLTKGFNFARTSQRIRSVNKINGQDVGWTLGAVIYELSQRKFVEDISSQ